MQEAILILCAAAGIMTAVLIKRRNAGIETEANILELCIKKLKNDSNYTAERDALLHIYNDKLNDLKSNSVKNSQITQTSESNSQVKKTVNIKQKNQATSNVQQDIETNMVKTSTAKPEPNMQGKEKAVGQEPPYSIDAKPKTDTSGTKTQSKSKPHTQEKTAMPDSLPVVDHDTEMEAMSEMQDESDAAAQESLRKTDTVPRVDTSRTKLELETKPELDVQDKERSTKQESAHIVDIEPTVDTPSNKLSGESKIDAVLQENSKVESNAKTVDKKNFDTEITTEPIKSTEPITDNDDLDEEELEKIKKNVKEALAKLERAESE